MGAQGEAAAEEGEAAAEAAAGEEGEEGEEGAWSMRFEFIWPSPGLGSVLNGWIGGAMARRHRIFQGNGAPLMYARIVEF